MFRFPLEVLADHHRVVASVLHPNRKLILGQTTVLKELSAACESTANVKVGSVGAVARIVSVLTAKQTGSRRAAKRRRDVAVGESNAVTGKIFQVRIVFQPSIANQINITIVNVDQNNIRFSILNLRRSCRCHRESEQQHREQR
jgi:hypothetical protein